MISINDYICYISASGKVIPDRVADVPIKDFENGTILTRKGVHVHEQDIIAYAPSFHSLDLRAEEINKKADLISDSENLYYPSPTQELKFVLKIEEIKNIVIFPGNEYTKSFYSRRPKFFSKITDDIMEKFSSSILNKNTVLSISRFIKNEIKNKWNKQEIKVAVDIINENIIA